MTWCSVPLTTLNGVVKLEFVPKAHEEIRNMGQR